jgi:hypothetical protein
MPGGPAPQQIRELVVNDPRESSSLGFFTLILVPAHNPAHQGMIYVCHQIRHSLGTTYYVMGQPPIGVNQQSRWQPKSHYRQIIN